MIRLFFKIPAFIITLLSYITISVIGDLVITNPVKKRKFFSKITSLGSKLGLYILGIHVNVCGKSATKQIKPVLQVANHMSYLDILILSSIYPSLYITSVELQNTLFLGLMARLGGSLFVERRSKTKLIQEIDRIVSVLRKGFTITLFPEGTSSNGEKVLPFKGALFLTAKRSNVEIQPVCIKYLTINGEPVSPTNRDSVFYYGDIVFFPHILKLLLVKSIEVEVTYFDPIKTDGRDRKELVDISYNKISSKFMNDYEAQTKIVENTEKCLQKKL
jgi:1-acyl-sn-glycerol-3-phosphate acyltransferase